MQKIFLCSCIVIALLLHMPVQRASLSFLMGEYTFYSTQMQSFDGCEVVKNGNFYHISCDATLAKTLNVKKVVGQSVKFAGNCDDFYIICKKLGKIKNQYSVDNVVVAEGFSQKFFWSVADKKTKINFQVAFDGKHITVGTPVIKGSF